MPKVLVIDDSVSVRKVVERALAGRQIEVVCAASGDEALQRIEQDPPDVIVCDVVMPDRDGYEICEFVKKHPRLGSTPVVLMSGIVNDEVRERAARARSEGVLAKPFAAEDLLKRLDGFLGQIPAKSPEPPAPSAAATAPAVATPTLMPVSSLTVEPITLPATAPLAPAPRPLASPAAPTAPSITVPPDLAPPSMLAPPPMAPPPSIAKPLTVATSPTMGVPPSLAPAPSIVAPGPVVERAAIESPAPPVASPAGDGVAAILAQFTAMDGVQWAVLADREGFVVEATVNAGVDADVAAALSACLAESSDGLGRELGRGTLHGIILEYEKGMVVVYGAGTAGLLAVGVTESAVLGKVRYFAKKALPELTRVL